MPLRIATCKAIAAWRVLGSSPIGVEWSTVIGKVVCAFNDIPVSMQAGILTGAPLFSTVSTVGTLSLSPGCFIIHPAESKTDATDLANWPDSLSKNASSSYSVPANGFKAATSSLMRIRDRGVFNLFSSASAFAALCKASARCDSAEAACVLAETMSFSKESASCVALLARFMAFPADVTASPDFDDASLADALALVADDSAWPAAFAAASADSLTCPNLLSVSPRIFSSCPRRAVSAWADRNSKIPSPITPATTNRSPRYAVGITKLFSFVGSTSFPLHSRYQRFRAIVASGASRATPIPTIMLERTSQKNQRSLSLASDSRTVSTAGEASNNRDEEVIWALRILAFLAAATVCEIVYICLRVKV